MKRLVVAVLAVGLVVAVAFTAYTRVYLPSTRPVLNGAPLVLPIKIEKLSAEPLSAAQPTDQERCGATLHEAIAAVAPGYRIDSEELYVRKNGYDSVALRTMAGEYLDTFGLRLSADAEVTVDGQSVDYLIWRPDWLHSVVEDRMVVAAMFGTRLADGAPAMAFGYFVLRPA